MSNRLAISWTTIIRTTTRAAKVVIILFVPASPAQNLVEYRHHNPNRGDLKN